MIAVLVACFAATTLDTATRLQRYVIQELAGTLQDPAADEQVRGHRPGRRAGWCAGDDAGSAAGDRSAPVA